MTKGAKVLTMKEYEALKKAKPKRNKYNASKCEWRGMKFDSKWELDYYQILLHRKNSGKIKDVELHVNFPIEVNGEYICRMNIDFVITNLDGSKEYHDTKSPASITAMFKLKAKLFKVLYGAEVEVKLKGQWL